MQDIEETLLDATRKSGLSMAELARRAELPYACVHGFLQSDRQITLHSAAAIGRVLGLESKHKGR